MDLYQYNYHNYPSSRVRKYDIFTLEDYDKPEGEDKYYFNKKESYVHNYLNSSRMTKIDKIFPKNIDIENQKSNHCQTEENIKEPEQIKCDEDLKMPSNLKRSYDRKNYLSSLPIIKDKNNNQIYDVNLRKSGSPMKNNMNPLLCFTRRSPPRRKYQDYNSLTFTNTGNNTILKPIHHFKIKKRNDFTENPLGISYGYDLKYNDYFNSLIDEKNEKMTAGKKLKKLNLGNSMGNWSLKFRNLKTEGKYMGERYNPYNFVIRTEK